MAVVGTWNIAHAARFGAARAGRAGRAGAARGVGRVAGVAGVDTAAMAATCHSFGVELLAVQEIERRSPRSRFTDQIKAVEAATGLHGVFASTTRVGGVGRYGHALFCAVPLDAVEVVVLSGDPSREARAVIVASAVLSFGPISVASTHLGTTRTDSEVQLQETIELLAARPGPRLLLGDLNRRPHELDDLRAAGFIPSCDIAPLHTYPSASPEITIDYIAADGVTLSSIESREVPVSDHRPVLGALRREWAS